jgi:hypothetical protein
MSRIRAAREGIVAALEPVWPGRVHAYGSEVPSGITVGIALPIPRTGTATYKAVRFPVSITADGSDAAQIGTLDEVTDRVLDAIDSTRHLRWVETRAETDPTIRTHSTIVLVVEATIGVQGFCAPAVVEAVTPTPLAS